MWANSSPSDTRAGVCDVINEWNEKLATDLGTNSYAGNFGSWGDTGESPDASSGLFGRNSQVRVRDIIDGTSRTLAVGERAAALTQAPWAGAVAYADNRNGFAEFQFPMPVARVSR